MLVKNLQKTIHRMIQLHEFYLTEFMRPILAALLLASALVVQFSKVAKQDPPGRVT